MLARRSTLIALATLVVTLASVFSPTPPAAEAATTTRIAGSDRYETSALVAARIAPASGSTVFIANGLDFADALAAGPVAAAEGGVLLLSRVSEIPPSIRAQIIAIAPSEIVIVGGEGAIDANVAAALQALAPTVTRIGGLDRVETSFLLFQRLRLTTPAATVWVAAGLDFPDALAASAVAGRTGAGVLLTNGAGDTFPAQLAQLQGVTSANVVGGSAVVPDSVIATLQSHGISTTRIAGADRFETAILINRVAPPTGGVAVLATAFDFPDALSAGVLAARLGTPLYLTRVQCAGPLLQQEAAAHGITSTIAVGGESVLSSIAATLANCQVLPSTAELTAWFNQLNAARVAAGLQPFTYSLQLEAIAGAWSNQMAGANTMSHNPAYGAQIRAVGCTAPNENVAWSGYPYTSPITLWRNSSPHWTTIMDPNLTHIGLGTAYSATGRQFTTLNLGRC